VAENEREWIVEPPGRGEIAVHIAVGDGVKLTEEQEQAISDLVWSLEAADTEVTGHGLPCPKQGNCGKMKCPSFDCTTMKCGTFKDYVAAAPGGWNLMGTFGGAA
jgi:hypothetical protein